MALKGTTKIELTNVKTGEKEIVKHDNLVTNAVPSIVSDNPFAWQLKAHWKKSEFLGNVLPLCPNLFGGILLYEDAIPEDVNQLYAQSDNKLIGYSSNNVNDKTDIMRGSMNQNESGPLESRDGYRFVFDFTTAQANGTISAVGLTSKWGGMSGYGSMEWPNTQSPTVFYLSATNIDVFTAYMYQNMVHYDDSTGIATSLYVSSQGIITVTKVQMHTKNWKLLGYMDYVDPVQIVETTIIEPKVFACTTVDGRNLFHNFCDGGDGYVWGVEHAANAEGNSQGKASINWIKIKIEDLTFEEGTWEIDGQIRSLGRRHKDPGTGTSGYWYMDYSSSVILDGYLYCLKYDLTGLYKVDLENITNIQFIEHPDKKLTCYEYRTYSSSKQYFDSATANITVAGNRVCMWDCYLNGDVLVRNMVSTNYKARESSDLSDGWIDTYGSGGYPQRCSAGLHLLNMGVFSLAYQSIDSTVNARLLLNSPYLATINNLATPVQKTADKTMKITYILREETA